MTQNAQPPAATGGLPEGLFYSERFRGTEWDTRTREPPPQAPPKLPTWLLVGSGASLIAMAVGVILVVQLNLLDERLPVGAQRIVIVLGIWFAGLISRIIPGRMARGLLSSYVVGWLGANIMVAVAFYLSNGQFLADVVNGRGAIEVVLLAIVGAMAVRFAFWVVGWGVDAV